MNIEQEKNKDAIKMAWAKLEQRVRVIKQGGGKSSIKKLNEKGKLSARQRINQLVDDLSLIHISEPTRPHYI